MSEKQADYYNEIEQWGIVELMGRKVVAGKISKSELMGSPMLRVDIPAVGDIPAFTAFYGAAAIYGITIVSEQYAKQAAAATRTQPVLVYELRRLLESHGTGPDEDDFDDYNDHDDEDEDSDL